MVELIINILFVTGGAGIGVAAGWWLKGSTTDSDALQKDNADGEQKESPNMANVEGLMARLHQLTTSVAADVGAHSDHVKRINEELTSSTATPESIVAVVERLVLANEQMNGQLKAAEGRLRAQADEIQTHVQEARTDSLTTLFNRRGFDDELSAAVQTAREKGRPVSLMMMDVDFFKNFNDMYGHQAGDEVLKSVAQMFRSNLTEREIVCRYGGEEFAAIFVGSDCQSAVVGVERVRAAIQHQVVNFDGMDLRVTASAGLSELLDNESSSDFVKRADQALYASKTAGRNQTHWHDGFQPHPVNPADETATVPATAEKVRLSQSSQQESETVPPPAFPERLSGPEQLYAGLDRRLGEYRRGGATLSLIMMGVDRFDSVGAEAALVIERAAAQFLKATIRDMDHIAQIQPGRFALLLPTATIENSHRVAERLRRAVERCVLAVGEQEVRFTVSIGVVEVAKSETREDILARTKVALFRASAANGNRVCSGTGSTIGIDDGPQQNLADVGV